MKNESIDIRKLKKLNTPLSTNETVAVDGEGVWNFLNKDIELFGQKVSESVKESFYIELATLLDAGVDIKTSLQLIREEQKKAKLRQVFSEIETSVVSGETLSSSLRNCKYFTNYEYFSVQIGEETGKLTAVLKEMSLYFKKRINQKRQIVAAMTYPIIVMSVAIGAIVFMMTYVVPMFADLMKRVGSDLPFVTKCVLNASALVRNNIGILSIAVLALFTVWITQRKKLWFRSSASLILLRLPLIGKIVSKIYLARFSGTMSLLIASKIPILKAMDLVEQMINFYPIESTIPSIKDKILTGTSLHKSMGAHSIYPTKMISLLKVGEDVNQLDVFFSRIAEQYNNEVEYQTNMLSKLLEPVIIVLLGLVVGVILIAMYLPLFKLGQAF